MVLGRNRQALLPSRSVRAGQAGLLMPLAAAAALLMLVGSLSLQTLSLQARRQLSLQLQQRQQQDLLSSAAQQLLGRLKQRHSCLLELPSSQWSSAACLGAEAPEALQRGQIGGHDYLLLSLAPTATGAELRLALNAGGPTAAFALVNGALRELGLRAALAGPAAGAS